MPSDNAASQSMMELAELAGGFIHEIKNHLNTLSLNLQLLGEDLEGASTPRERMAADRAGKISEECRRLLELANDFLRFSRVAELNLQPTDLGGVVSRMVDFLTPTARLQNVEIRWHPTPDLPRVWLDPDMFEKVLLNLMLNAEDAMPEGGFLTLQTRGDERFVYLDVIDTGCGIDPNILGKIFVPFVTTKPDGHGLGLATSKKIVLAHGGQIDAQSEFGRGTKFTVALPIANP